MAGALPTEDRSVFDFAVPRQDLVPSADEPARFIRVVEACYTDSAALEGEIDRWYVV